MHAALWLPLILATTLWPLRAMKSLLIALQFHHKAAEGRLIDARRNERGRAQAPRGRLRHCSRWSMVAVFVGLGALAVAAPRREARADRSADERLAAAPVPLPPPSQWSALTPARDEFRRVSFTATYATLPDAMVYSSGSAVREDVSGPGTWAFLPARLPAARRS